MLVRRAVVLSLLILLATALPSNLKLVFAEGRLPTLTFVCHDNNWEDGEYCGRDAVVATGGWTLPSPPAASAVPDMNHDCVVNGLDFALFVPQYAGSGMSGPDLSSDFNNDGTVTSPEFSFINSRVGHTAVPCNPTAIPVLCDGNLFISDSPSSVADNANKPIGVYTAYFIIQGVTNAQWVELSVKSSANVQVLAFQYYNPADTGQSFLSCNGMQTMGFWLAAPASGTATVGKVVYQVNDTNPGFLTISPQTCAFTRNRWTTAAIPQVSHEFATVGSFGINGPTPGPTPACTPIGTVTGNVYADVSNDCVFNGNDTPVSGRRVVLTPGPYFGFTDAAGNYSIAAAPGDYTVSVANYNDPWKQLSDCQTAALPVTVVADATSGGNNFALKPFGTIKGRVYRDYDNSTQCVFDGIDFALANRTLQFTPGGYTTLSDALGNYSIKLPTGQYLVTAAVGANDPFAVRNSCFGGFYLVNVGTNATMTGNDFPMQLLPGVCSVSANIVFHAINDVPSPCSRPYRGPCATVENEYLVTVRTNSQLMSATIPANSVVDVTLDPAFSINSVSSTANFAVIGSPTPNRRLVQLQDPLNPGDQRTLVIRATPATDGNYSHSVSYNAGGVCSPVAVTRADESKCTSCDPNDMAVQPACGVNNEILPGKTMTYTVRFENIGLGAAHNIYIEDVLDADLDPSSLLIVSSSHTVTGVQMSTGNKLVINFDGINLPGTGSAPANKGYVMFSLDQKPGLVDGTTISNAASIFFDFNAPVVTNTTTSTVQTNPCAVTGVETRPQPMAHYMGPNYPNPFNPATTIDYALASPEMVSIAVYNIRGELIRTLVSERKLAGWYSVEWDGRDQRGNPVASGVYVTRMRAGSFADSKKLVLLK